MKNNYRERVSRSSGRVFFLRKQLSLFLIFAIVLSAFFLCMVDSEAAAREEKSRAIAIVFDNSGSMFENESWCRAIYSMEVFASMANDGDEIAIYPMHPIEVGGKDYDSKSPLIVEGGGNASLIRDIYTPRSLNTPIETITDAYEGLMDMSADEKWLIVLTDGAEFYENDIPFGDQGRDTEQELGKLLSVYNDSVNLLYLGIDYDYVLAAEPVVNGSMKSDVQIAEDSSQILDKLSEMCNMIYGRDEMEVSSDTFETDLSMTKMILFVQGSDISGLKLVDSDGNEVGTPVSSYSPHYAEPPGSGSVISAPYNYPYNAADESLSGEIVTYENVPAGTYTLVYDEGGSVSSRDVYYEPNVSIRAFLLDEDGNNVLDLGEDEIYDGTYRLEFGLVDEYGNFTESELLGDREFDITYTITGEDGEERTQTEHTDRNGSITIELQGGDEMGAFVEATYLNGYKVSTDSDAEWPFPIQITQRTPSYELAAELDADSYYVISKMDEADPIVVSVTHNGEPLTQEEMAVTGIDISCGDLDCSGWEVTKDTENSRFLVTPQIDKSDAGVYELAAVVTTLDEKGEVVQAGASGRTEFEKYPRWLRWAVIAAIIAIIVFIIITVRNRKVLPKHIGVKDTSFTVDGEPVSGNAKLSGYVGGKKTAVMTITAPKCPFNPLAKCGMTLTMEAVDPRKKKSSQRAVIVKSAEPTPSHGVDSYKIGAVTFTKDPDTNKFKRSGSRGKKEGKGGKEDSPGVRLTNNQKCIINGEVLDDTGAGVPISLSVTLKYQ